MIKSLIATQKISFTFKCSSRQLNGGIDINNLMFEPWNDYYSFVSTKHDYNMPTLDHHTRLINYRLIGFSASFWLWTQKKQNSNRMQQRSGSGCQSRILSSTQRHASTNTLYHTTNREFKPPSAPRKSTFSSACLSQQKKLFTFCQLKGARKKETH